jgi:hypothetical protein
MAITETKKEVQITEHFYWIKGHQDNDNTPVEELSWPAQLNIQADALATRALEDQQKRGRKPPPMIRLPACTVYLLSQGVEQTSQEMMTLKTDLSRYKMEEYLMARNKWEYTDMATVAWVPYEQAMNTLTDKDRIFVVKLTHRWLPVATRQFREGAETDQCILCKEKEDIDHLYKCQQRKDWKEEFKKALRDEMDILETAADTRNAIIKRVEQWLDDKEIDESPQDAIGWGAFIRGYISQHWVNLQEKYYRNNKNRNVSPQTARRHTGNYWAKHLIDFLWRQGRKLWHGRNEKVHEPDKEGDNSSPIERRNLQNKITLLYAAEPFVREADRSNFFSQRVEEVIKGPTRELKAWLTTYGPAIKRAIQDAAILDRLGNRDIRDYFDIRDYHGRNERASS